MAGFIIHSLLVLLVLYSSASSQQKNGHQSEIFCCVHCYADAEHFSIDNLQSKINQNSTKIQFCSETTNLKLHTTITVNGLHDIMFNGATNKTEINCTGSENAGLEFIEVKNLIISSLTLTGCGFSFRDNNGKRTTERSIHILNCTHVSVINVSVNQGKGSGIVFYDTVGNNTVTSSSFSNNNAVHHGSAGAGGVHVEFKRIENNEYGEYTFQDCKFIENQVQIDVKDDKLEYGVGRGGGMMVFFRGSSSNITISIVDCLYEGNSAIWGGGMYALYVDTSMKNRVTIIDSTFRNNSCENAGGGIDIGLKQETSVNKFVCINCTFVENKANIGGGAAVFSRVGSTCAPQEKTVIFFKNSTWIRNVAQYGAAVDLSPQHESPASEGEVPETIFENCNFINNNIVTLINHCNKSVEITNSFTNNCHNKNGKGTFLVTEFHVRFEGVTMFDSNNGSAVYAISSDLLFESGSWSEFKRNTGTNGGAIALIGLSAIVVDNNSTLLFTNNTAVSSGGAIYYFSFDHHDYVFSHNCFIKCSGTAKDRNIMMYFAGNKAITSQTQNRTELAHYGNSIHAMTMIPCFKVWRRKYINSVESIDMLNVFNFIGNVHFNDSDPKITTSGAYFNITNRRMLQKPVQVIPGRKFELPISLNDDFDQKVKGIYRVSIKNHNHSNVKLGDTYVHISDNRLELYGQPGEAATLTLTTIGFREVSVSIEVKMRECPPLFLPRNDKCKCSRSSNDMFISLHQCHNDLFKASLRHGYWIGYTDSESFKHLFYGYCPSKYCFDGLHNERYHNLTSEASKELLDKIVCGESRTGILCGECRDNYSAYYHSPHFECGQNHLCEIGWLLYAISELLPLTLLFILVIVFDISFTSGPLNGFILFAQVFDSISNNGQGFILYPYSVYILKTIALVIYKLFNFDFFSVDELSYCLWKGATTLDVLTFKFLTVAYVLALVFVTIWLTDHFGKCCNRRKTTVTRSITHGLSAFLVMVHAQCTTISFKILQLVHLSSHGSPSSHKTVVFYQGNIDYFSPRHLAYAFPALLCIMTLVAIPPIVLLVYPLCNKIIAFLNLDNWKAVSWMSRKIPMVRLKPMIDTFQGCFKDEYRYFAGLYFVYRIAFIACTLGTRLTQVYTIYGLLLITVLVIHAVTWPYEKRWHNTLDGLIIFNLAVINGLSLFSYSYAQYGRKYQRYIDIATSVELVFIYGPLIYIGVYVITIITRKFKEKCIGTKNEDTAELWRDEDLPARLQNLDDLSDTESETDYQLYEL